MSSDTFAASATLGRRRAVFRYTSSSGEVNRFSVSLAEMENRNYTFEGWVAALLLEVFARCTMEIPERGL